MAAFASRFVFVFGALQASAFAGVHIVDATGRGDQLSIGAAVAAASDGDLVLVRSGSYPGFVVDNKALVIARDAGALVTIAGTIEIDNLAAGKTLVLASLTVDGLVSSLAPGPALTLAQDVGHVRVEDCVLHGARGFGGTGNPWNPGSNAVELQDCFDTAFVRCTLRGGEGEGTAPGQGFFDFGGTGGDGLRARFSAVALYDCTLTGGAGGGGEGAGGDGGRGCDHDQGGGGAFLGNCVVQGGDGGYAHGFGIGGAGGDALFASSACHDHLFDSTPLPGYGGPSTGYPAGHNGTDFGGPGTHEVFAGNARSLSADFLAKAGGELAVVVHGQPGDRVYVQASERTGFQFAPGLDGVRLLPKLAPLSADPLLVLPASGVGGFLLPLGNLAAGHDTSTLFLQGYVVDAGGTPVLGSPLFAQLLRCSSLAPDCNGNGSFDTCDLLDGSAQDLGHDGIPDSCDPDCNGNGLPDDLDILNGTSVDANGNGVPDSCEGAHTIHVDVAAPPFGNGSASAPFQTISQGIAASSSGDTVLVEDGTYTGALNRDMSLGSRSIVIASAHGPAACVIDGAALGRAFAVHEGESPATTIRGFTVRNGRVGAQSWGTYLGGGAIVVFNSSASIENCRFESCLADQGGGAVFGQAAALAIRSCSFVGNGQPTTYSPGGGLRLQGGSAVLRACVFEQNVGSAGGGLLTGGGMNLTVEGCSFRGNQALIFGGGAALESAGLLDNCLIAGNTAPHGAGLSAQGGLTIVHCTIAANSATQDAGGLYCAYDNSGATLSLRDTIVWGNSAPSAAQIGSVSFSDILQLRSCDLQGGTAGIVLGAGVLDSDASNIVLDPLFVSPNGADGNPNTWADNDLHLGLLSPCIDAANNLLVPPDTFDLDADGNLTEPEPFDLDRSPRFVDVPTVNDTGFGTQPITDIGAYEHGP